MSSRRPGSVLGIFRRAHLGTEADRATFRTLHTASLASPALREGLTEASAERSAQAPAQPARGARDRASPAAPSSSPGTARGATTPTPRRPSPRSSSSTATPGSSTTASSPASRGAAWSGTRSSPRWWSTSRSSAPSRCSRRTPPPASPAPRRGRPVGLRAARARRARRLPHPAHGGRGAGAAGPDLPALRLQLARRDRVVRAHRPRPGPRAAAGVRRLHPLLLPAARRVHHPGRGAALHRALPARSSRPASATGSRSRCGSHPRCCPSCVPFLCVQPLVENAVRHGLEASADKEDGVGRLTIEARDLDQECVIEVEDDGRGEDPDRVRRVLAGDARATRSGSATSTRGCATPSATTTVSSSRPLRAPAPRSSSGCPSSHRGCTYELRAARAPARCW